MLSVSYHIVDGIAASEVQQHQMEDPEYAAARGISVVHFAVGPGAPHSGQWMMLSSPSGKASRSILEDDTSRLSHAHRSQLEERNSLLPMVQEIY